MFTLPSAAPSPLVFKATSDFVNEKIPVQSGYPDLDSDLVFC